MKCQEDEMNKVFQKYTKVIQICFVLFFKKEYICMHIFMPLLVFVNRKAVFGLESDPKIALPPCVEIRFQMDTN